MDSRYLTFVLGAALVMGCRQSPQPDPVKMSFFVTSVPAGDGGSIGGLGGADAHCQKLAMAAGSPRAQWRAYLSAPAQDGQNAVNARDRIGAGPWFNAYGVQIAANLDELHGKNNIGAATALFEKGVTTRFYPHDMMTGSNPDGTLAAGDSTCRNWTSTAGQTMLGHSDRRGGMGGDRAQSWNSAHPSNGCSLSKLRETGGGGLYYCFAADPNP
jgi:hypothetical protein